MKYNINPKYIKKTIVVYVFVLHMEPDADDNTPKIPPVSTHNAIALANQVVADIYEKYKTDEYMFQKAHYYICNQLPIVLENMKRTHEQSQIRIRELENEQDTFIQTFLNHHQYFYVSSTEKFFYYDRENYHVYNEDNILHHVLSTISKEKQLMTWKKSTKVYVMKRIKENNLLKSVPETETIQTVLDALYPALFRTRAEAKYFLTMLGDNLFRKSNELVYLISPKSKPFIRELTNISQMLLGGNCGVSLKHKYYEHEYAQCRLIHINDCIVHEPTWRNIIHYHALNLLCVACHYSVRYANADTFVSQHCNEPQLMEHCFFLKNHTKEELVARFAREYLTTKEPRGPSTQTQWNMISWRNVQYLWKHFLNAKQVPTVMFQQTLKTMFIQLFVDKYQPETETFVGLTSVHLPTIQKFLSFWEETITVDETLSNMEYEVEELCFLFKRWQETRERGNVVLVSDTEMLELITFYFPGISVENAKYVFGIRCALWDKQQDIYVAMEQLKENIRLKYYSVSGDDAVEHSNTTIPRVLPIVSSYGTFERAPVVCPPSPTTNGVSNISIYDAYVWYCKYYSDKGMKHKASKSYFEKYLCEIADAFLVDSNFLSAEWAFSE